MFFIGWVSLWAWTNNCCTSDYSGNNSTCTMPTSCSWENYWCNNDPADTRSLNVQDLNRFLAILRNEHWNPCSVGDVARIQGKMQQIWWSCSTCIDWKAWDRMRSTISTCLEQTSPLCPAPKKVPLYNGSNLYCADAGFWVDLYDGRWCCIEYPPLGTPEMEQTYREQYLSVNITISVSDDYYTDEVDDDSSKISASNADWSIPSSKLNLGSCQNTTNSVVCELIIHVTWSDVTITLWEWFFTLDDINDNIIRSSSQAVQTFTRVEPQDCGSTPKSGGIACTTTYGPSYTESGTCCVTQCAIPQKTWWGCNTWYIKDGSGCCVQNNCQNPPLTWTQDCSNQFWWRWVYSGAIECCVDSWSCANPPASPWQCNWNLVLDSAGQCCITCQNPVNSSGNCQSWYTAQWNCCFANNMCWNSWYNEWWQCHQCEEWTVANAEGTKCVCDPNKKCCWIQLNTVVPFIWDCIEMTASSRWDTTSVTSVTAFPVLMQWLMKILMSAIMIFSFLMVIIAWFMMTTWAFSSWNFAKWKTILKNVIISLILLGCSWLILSLINPNFFGG